MALLLRLTRLSLYLALTLPLMPVQMLLVALGSPLARSLPLAYHRICIRLLGFRLAVKGAPSRDHPTLYAVNHMSYLDIMVLGALLKASFIAKAEVAHWPLFGTLARLQRTVFVSRTARAARAQHDEIGTRLAAGDDLILFPEGTSSDGNRVLPFKSALFSVAERRVAGRPIAVQPVSIAYTRLNGMPMGRFYRPFFAWYGDMDMAPHLWTLLGLGIVTVVVEFHAPVTAAAYPSRKALAEACRRMIADGVAAALSGRDAVSVEGAPVAAPAGVTVAGAQA
jgi:1-acyl-sn-glycerol-3-phosphate acyltransferase